MKPILPIRLLLAVAFLAGLLLGAAMIFVLLVAPRQNPVLAQTPPTAVPTPTLVPDADYAFLDARDQVLTNLYQRISPSVVHVTSRSETIDIFGVQPSEGTGSGFVYDQQGHVVTNNHVVAGADSVDVVLPSGVSLSAQVVGTDTYYDLAVLHIAISGTALAPLELGDSSQLRVGQTVIAIGNPFGLDRTLTSGLVSALGRRVQTDAGSVIGQAIQTDAAINPGNSGGPLLDTRGRVVGINTAINSPSGGSVGIGFAVPVNIIKRVVPALISKGHFAHPSLGITTLLELGTDVNPPDSGPQHGLLIAQIDPGGPAAQAGLKGAQITRQRFQYIYSGGDIITALDGKTIATKNDLLVALEESHQPGDTVTLTVSRDGQSIDVKVTLGEQ
ncbi:MAG TPA: trypsin-like peptidase domain-containing protein [Aggregatilineales bacterium]|nr:trypsin-like peptidase domain-containing protein [Aggregatilineales bacterium]